MLVGFSVASCDLNFTGRASDPRARILEQPHEVFARYSTSARSTRGQRQKSHAKRQQGALAPRQRRLPLPHRTCKHSRARDSIAIACE